jgi:hypothetical protein
MRARGDVGRGDGRAVACVGWGWVPLGVLMVRGRDTSRSKDALLGCVDVTCSTRSMYRLSAADEVLVSG